MAIIQYTAIVNQIRGKLNGSVFNKSKNGYTLQRKAQPKQGGSHLQYLKRSKFAQAQRHWQELNQQQKENYQISAINNPVYDRFGELVVLSAYNHFVKVNVMSLALDDTYIEYINPGSASSYNYTLLHAGFDPIVTPDGTIFGNMLIEIDVHEYQGEDITYFLYASLPVSNGVTVYSKRWFLGGSKFVPVGTHGLGNQEIGFFDSPPQNYPGLEVGQRVFMKLDAWVLHKGALINSQIIEFFIE